MNARPIISNLLTSRMTFTPTERPKTCKVTGAASLDGLFSAVLSVALASPMPASWNQIANWLKQIDGLRQAA